jgi:hypothetical protein
VVALLFACAPVPAPELEQQLSYDAAVDALRDALRERGLGASVANGAVVAWPPPEHPDSALTDLPATPDGQPWPEGEWLVETSAGRWWVGRHLAVYPADNAARLAERLAASGLPGSNRWSGRADE